MNEAIQLAKQGMQNNEGGPFGAVVVKDNQVVGRGHNRVTSVNDPTAHAEVCAIREACKNLDTYRLEGCEIYTSCEPCPMCLAAIYWAHVDKIFYACTRKDAASIGFDDDFLYKEINLIPAERKIHADQIMQHEAYEVFKQWMEKVDKMPY